MMPNTRCRIAVLTASLLAVSGAGTLPAQVGHDPGTSPYRDIRHSNYLVFSAGRFFGTGGQVGVGPHHGTVVGLRLSFLANKALQLNIGGFYGTLERLVYDPLAPEGSRFSGPEDNTVVWVDGSIHFNLTGGKTWRGLAPYVGAGTGVAFSENLADDPASFRMGSKFTLIPLVGTRFFLADRLALTAEGRFNFWKISYTTPFAGEGVPEEEWVVTPWVNIGLAWAFAWPF